MILHDKSDKVLFANKAAEKQFDLKVNARFRLSFKSGKHDPIDFEAKIF